MDLFDLVARIRIDTEDFENGLNNASNSLKNVGKSVEKTGSTLTKNVTLPIAGIGAAIMKAGMDYEAGMDQVQAISGATGTDIEALGDKAMEMAAKTKFSTAESAEAYKYMAMAGWKTQDMLNALDAVMYLAGASGESLATTSDIVTDAMTAFGLAADGTSTVIKNGVSKEVSNATRFTDVLAAASNNANTNVAMLGESFKFVAPVAGSMGYSIEDVAIALGLMANSGIKASMGGTALRSILTNLANPTDKMSAAMDTLGVSMTDSEGNAYSLLEIMDQLRAGFGGGSMDSQEFADKMAELQTSFEEGSISEKEYEEAVNSLAQSMYGVEGSQKAAIAAQLAGKYSMAGLLAIVGAAPKDYDKLTEAIYNSNGATEEMYGVMTDNAQGALTMLSSAINVLFTNLSEFLIPAFTDIVKKITEVVNAFNELDDGTKKTILTIAGIAAVVGPVLIVIGKVITAIGTIGTALGSVISIIGKISGVVSSLFALIAAHPVVAAVTAIIAAIVLLWNNCEEFREFFINLWEGLKEVVSSFAEWFKEKWNSVKEFFSGLWNGFKEAVSNFGDWFNEKVSQIVDWFKEKWDGIKDFFSGIWESLKEIISSFGEWVSGKMGEIVQWIKEKWEGISEFFSQIWEGIKNVFASVAEFFGEVFTAAVEAIKTAWNGVKEFFSEIWEGIKAVFSVVAEVLGGFFSAAWEAIKTVWGVAAEFFSGVWEAIQEIFSVAEEVLGGFFKAAWKAIKTVWDAAVDFFTTICDGIQSVFEAVTEFLENAFSEAWEAIKAVWEKAKEFFQGIWDAIKGAAEKAASTIGDAFKKAWDAVKSVWDNAISFFRGIVDKIVGVFSNIGSRFLSIGKNIVDGIKNGISNAWSSFIGWLSSKITGIVDAVKGMLGIHSPSKVFAGIGENMALGLAEGWDDEYRGIKHQIENGLDFGAANIGLNASHSGTANYDAYGGPERTGNGWGGTTVNIYSPVAVDAVQAAREWKKTSQQIAMGLV